jgi:hypothetical protein
MTLNAQSLGEWLGALSVKERTKVLILLSFRLTIHARGYDLSSMNSEQDENARRKLLGINEMQHNLLAQAGHYLDGSEASAYPTDVLCQILFETADHHGIASVLSSAANFAKDRSSPSNK